MSDIVEHSAQHAADPDVPFWNEMLQSHHANQTQDSSRHAVHECHDVSAEDCPQKDTSKNDEKHISRSVVIHSKYRDDIGQSQLYTGYRHRIWNLKFYYEYDKG